MSAATSLSKALRDRRTPPKPRVPLRNLLLGSLVGSAIMLLGLRVSRPYYLDLITGSPLDRSLAATAAVARGNRLPDPGFLSGRAMWFSVAAGRLLRGEPQVKTEEIETVEGLMAKAAQEEPANAFWLQADAVLLERIGRPDQAKLAWIAASKRLAWDDHQNEYLSGALVGRRGVPAYGYAELYELRTSNAAELIKQGCRNLLKASWDDPDLGIKMRLAAVLNGNLVRQRARSTDVMRVGTEIIESAVSRPSDEPEPSQHHLEIARTDFYKAVAAANLGYDQSAIKRFFDEADAARALATIEDVQAAMQAEAAEAAVIHSAPGSFLGCALLGAALLAARFLLGRFYGAGSDRRWIRTGVIAAVAVTGALFLTSVYAAVALGLCVLFAGTTPAHTRKRRPTGFGPLFSLMTWSVGLALFLAGAFGLILSTAPSRVLLMPRLPEAFNGSAAVCGAGALAIGLLFLCAPLWGYAQRLPTSFVLEAGFREVSQKLILGSLFLGVVSGPTCVFLDRLLVDSRLKPQFDNEFLFYYQKLSPPTPTSNDADVRP